MSYQTGTNSFMKTYSASSATSNETKSYFTIAVTAVSAVLAAIGSGGNITANNLTNIASWNQQFYDNHVQKDEKINPVSDSQNKYISNIGNLEYIKKYSGLNMSTLSAAFNVSRPTLYSWFKDGEPKPEIQPYLLKFAKSVESMSEEVAPKNLGKLITRPIFDGKSFLDLIFTDYELSDHIQKIKQLSRSEQEIRNKLKGNNSSTLISKISEFSKPISHS